MQPTTHPSTIPLLPELFQLLPLYARIFLLIMAVLILLAGSAFLIRAARTVFSRSNPPDDPPVNRSA